MNFSDRREFDGFKTKVVTSRAHSSKRPISKTRGKHPSLAQNVQEIRMKYTHLGGHSDETIAIDDHFEQNGIISNVYKISKMTTWSGSELYGPPSITGPVGTKLGRMILNLLESQRLHFTKMTLIGAPQKAESKRFHMPSCMWNLYVTDAIVLWNFKSIRSGIGELERKRLVIEKRRVVDANNPVARSKNLYRYIGKYNSIGTWAIS